MQTDILAFCMSREKYLFQISRLKMRLKTILGARFGDFQRQQNPPLVADFGYCCIGFNRTEALPT